MLHEVAFLGMTLSGTQAVVLAAALGATLGGLTGWLVRDFRRWNREHFGPR